MELESSEVYTTADSLGLGVVGTGDRESPASNRFMYDAASSSGAISPSVETVAAVFGFDGPAFDAASPLNTTLPSAEAAAVCFEPDGPAFDAVVSSAAR